MKEAEELKLLNTSKSDLGSCQYFNKFINSSSFKNLIRRALGKDLKGQPLATALPTDRNFNDALAGRNLNDLMGRTIDINLHVKRIHDFFDSLDEFL